MSGLDPLGRRLVRDLILDLHGSGKDRPLLHPHPLRRRDPVRPGGGAARRPAGAGRARWARCCAPTSLTWRSWSRARRAGFPALPGETRREVGRRPHPPRGRGGGPRPSGGGDRGRRGPRARGAAGAPVARRLLLPGDERRAEGGAALRGGMNRLVAVAANTFRETVRERVLYNLVFFASHHDPLGASPRPAVDPTGGEGPQGHRPRGHGPLRHPDRHLHRGGPGEQGDRAPLALPPARQAAVPGRVLPGQVRGAGLHPADQPRGDDRRALRDAPRDRGGAPTRTCWPRSTRSSSG